MGKAKIFIPIVFFIYYIILVINGIDSTPETNKFLTILCLSSYALCLYSWLSRGNRVFSLFVLFVLYSMLSNLGQSLLYLFGYPMDELLIYIRESFIDINYMLLYQGLCISAMNVGVAFYLRKKEHILTLRDQAVFQRETLIGSSSRYDYFLNMVLWLSLIVAVVNCIKMIVMRQHIGYMELYDIRTAGDNGGIFSSYLTYLSLFLALRQLLRGKQVKLIVSIYLILIAGYMVTGSRGLAFPYIAVLIATIPGLFPKYFKGYYNIVWVCFVFGFLVISGMISETRATSLSSIDAIDGSAIDFFKGAVSEMGASARPTIITMYVNDRGFPHVQTILYMLTYILPFTNKIPLMELQGIVLSDWVTQYVGSDSGLGYSFIAESYMNYGWYGCIFIGLYGYFIAWAENSSYRMIVRKPFWAILLLMILCKQIFFARAELILLGSTLRFSLYTAILYFIFKKK